MTTFAIDPGPHTGIVYWTAAGFATVTLDFTDVSKHQLPYAFLYHWLDNMIDPNKDRIICESFEFRKEYRDKEYLNYQAGEFVGTIKTFAEINDVLLYMQSASQAKAFWTDDKIKKLGIKTKSKHEKDALRHWLYHRTFTEGIQEFLVKLK